MKRFRGFIIGVVVGAAGLALCVALYFRLGFAPVAVSAAPFPFEKYFARSALHAQTEGSSGVLSPLEPTEANLVAGARTYSERCAICHGLPGQGKTDLQRGIYPAPPSLLTGKGVTDDPVGETHWVVQHGIRMTAMPAFDAMLSDDQIWQVSLLLSKAHGLPAAALDQLKQTSARP